MGRLNEKPLYILRKLRPQSASNSLRTGFIGINEDRMIRKINPAFFLSWGRKRKKKNTI
jgi:hypothetical protein